VPRNVPSYRPEPAGQLSAQGQGIHTHNRQQAHGRVSQKTRAAGPAPPVADVRLNADVEINRCLAEKRTLAGQATALAERVSRSLHLRRLPERYDLIAHARAVAIAALEGLLLVLGIFVIPNGNPANGLTLQPQR
jgi:hypothetical protein